MINKISADNLTDPITAHLHTNMITLREEQTAGEAVNKFRQMNITDKIVYLYVLDKDDRLVGVVPVRRLLGSDPGATMESIMVSPVISIPTSSSVLEACEMLQNHRLLALPVVDTDVRLQGIIDLSQFTDDVLTSTQQQMDSAFQLIGVHIALGRRVSSWRSFKDRFPWLLCNIASGIICAFIASRYELLLSQVVILAMFLTVVLALGESVSMQSMTITIQSLLGRQMNWRQILLSTRKEFSTSIMLGLGCGGILFMTAWLWRGQPMQAIAIGGSVCLSIITSCFLGVAIPTIIHKMKIDPKVSAGPIVLASADVATLLFYFNLSLWLLG